MYLPYVFLYGLGSRIDIFDVQSFNSEAQMFFVRFGAIFWWSGTLFRNLVPPKTAADLSSTAPDAQNELPNSKEKALVPKNKVPDSRN